MALRPSLREKKRYIVYEVVCEQQLASKDVRDAIFSACRKYLGEFTMAKSNLAFLDNTFARNRGVLRCANKSLNEVKAALVLVTGVGGRPATIRTRGVSGILKKAKSKFLDAPEKSPREHKESGSTR